MPAVSQVQQEAMGIELSWRESGHQPRRFNSMTIEQLRHFARTKRKGLPHRAHAARHLRTHGHG